MRILFGAKDAGQDAPGGIVDGREEDEAWSPILEPGMVTAVHLDEQAGPRHAFAAAAMPRRAAGARTADASLPEHALHGGPGQDQAVVLAEQVGEVMIIRASVAGARQGEDPASDGVG